MESLAVSSPYDSYRQTRRTKVRRVCFVALLGLVVLFWGWLTQRAATDLPEDLVSRPVGWADESRCAECHTQAETFWDTGHARTLQPANSTPSREFLARLHREAEHVDPQLRITASETGMTAVHGGDESARSLKLDWCFGSGLHARTWVGLLADSWGASDLCEFRWTWYESIDGFSVTPGQPDEGVTGYFGPLGVLHDHPKTRKCFACHATQLSMPSGRIDPHGLKPGVTCQRCHGPQAAHVESDGEFVDSSWRGRDQRDAVNRCGQCHRRADEMEPGQIRPDNRDIVRFQPVGLVQSPCFQNSEMTCITCHDPHLTLEEQDSLGIWQCLQCHDGIGNDHPLCAAGHADDCLRCHMPKVKMEDPLLFTDHWIRIRDDGEE